MSDTHSKACCETAVPAVQSIYHEKGSWTEIDNARTYITGPPTARRAILFVFDIFGFSPQTLRGADKIVQLSKEPVLVIVPDWFNGSVAQKSWVPPVTADQKQKLGDFIQNRASPELVVPRVALIADRIRQTFIGIERLGLLGFCWGGKLASLAVRQGGTDTPFVVAAQTSPARVDPEEARDIAVPMAMLVSGDEDVNAVQAYVDNLPAAKLLERFDGQIHGWMSARGDLDDPAVEMEYERGYRVVTGFFDEYL